MAVHVAASAVVAARSRGEEGSRARARGVRAGARRARGVAREAIRGSAEGAGSWARGLRGSVRAPRPAVRAGAAGADGRGSGGGGDSPPDLAEAPNGVLWAIWAGLIAYVALSAPDQTPRLDQIYLMGMVTQDSSVNAGALSLFNMMGIWPAVYAALLMPAASGLTDDVDDGEGSDRKGPKAWPFVVGSFAAGAFALLPYMALWREPARPVVARQGGPKGVEKVLESRVLGAALAAAAAALIVKGFVLPSEEEVGMSFRLFNSSKFIHVMSVDFATLALLSPLWISNDMIVRKWGPASGDSTKAYALAWAFAALPLVGPCIWLAVRPPLPARGDD